MRTTWRLGTKPEVKQPEFKEGRCPSPSESARRIRASLERRHTVSRAARAARLSRVLLTFAASFATRLAKRLRGHDMPQTPIDMMAVEGAFQSAIGAGVTSSRRLPIIALWLISAIVAIVAVLALALPFPLQSHANNPEVASANPTSRPVIVSPKPAATIVPAPPKLAVRPVTSPGAQHVSLSVKHAAWISACADGKEMFQIMVSPGDTPSFDFSNRAVLRIGNAAGVDLAVNGAAMGPLGAEGEVRLLELTHNGFRPLPLPPSASSNDCALY